MECGDTQTSCWCAKEFSSSLVRWVHWDFASVLWKRAAWINCVIAWLYFSPCIQTLTSRYTPKPRWSHGGCSDSHSLEDLSFHRLPDRNIIFVVAKRVHCLDVSYQPNFIDTESFGIHDTSFQCYLRWDVYTCKTMSCCRLAQPCSNGLLSTLRKNSRDPFHQWDHMSKDIFQRIAECLMEEPAYWRYSRWQFITHHGVSLTGDDDSFVIVGSGYTQATRINTRIWQFRTRDIFLVWLKGFTAQDHLKHCVNH